MTLCASWRQLVGRGHGRCLAATRTATAGTPRTPAGRAGGTSGWSRGIGPVDDTLKRRGSGLQALKLVDQRLQLNHPVMDLLALLIHALQLRRPSVSRNLGLSRHPLGLIRCRVPATVRWAAEFVDPVFDSLVLV